jgi:hypothetical protein
MARSTGFWAGVVFAGAAVGAVIATGYFVATYHSVSHTGMCTVTAENGDAFVRTSEQASNAGIVAAGAQKFGLGTNASTVALATAIQESGLRNLDYGDRDSLGLFQQRPSQGWGTAEKILDPHYATKKFYSHLATIDGWEDMRVTDAAQAVQRSGFPEAYEEHAPEAAAWAAALRGDEAFAAIDCDLDAVSTASTARAFADRLKRDYGVGVYTVTVLSRNDRAALIGITSKAGSEQELEAVANWSVAVADDQAVASVRLGGVQWLREQGIDPTASAVNFDGVLVGVVETVAND